MRRLGCGTVWIIAVVFLTGPFASASVASMASARVDGVDGSSWGSPVRVSSGGASTTRAWLLEGPLVAEDFYGNAIALWGQHEDETLRNGSIWTSRFIAGGGWTAPRELAVRQEGEFAPDVAMDPSGVTVAVWAANGSIWASEFVPEFLANQRTGWAPPVSTRGGVGPAQRPQVGLDGSGRALVVWEENEGNRTGLWVNSFANDVGWGQPSRIAQTGGRISPKVAIAPTGAAIVVWAGADAMERERLWGTSFDPVLGWKAPTAIDGGGCPLSASVAISPTGQGFVTWDESDGSCLSLVSHPLYAAIFDPVGGWSKAMKGPDGSQPQIVADSETGSTVLFCEVGMVSWVCGGVLVSGFTASAGWSSSTLVAHYPEARGCCPPKIAVDSFGRTLVVWSQIPEGADLNATLQEGRLMASYFLPGLGWQRPAAISPAYGARQVVAMNPTGDAVAVWVGFEGNTTVPQSAVWSNWFTVRAESTPPSSSITPDSLFIYGAFVISSAALALTLVSASYRHFRKHPRGQDGESFSTAVPVQYLRTVRGARSGSAATEHLVRGNGPVLRGTGRDWPKVNGALHLTVRERILLHLPEFSRYSDAVEVPTDLTQSGISRAAAVDLRHIAQYVRPLVIEGLIRERSAHVTGLAKKHKVYILADGGRHLAAGVRDRIRSAVIRCRDESGVHETTVGDVMAKRRGRSILETVRESIEAGVIDLRL